MAGSANTARQAPGPRPWDNPRRLVAGFVLLALGLLAAVQAVGLWLGRARAVEAARQRTDNLALILGEHARRTVGAIDATLRQLDLHAARIGGTGAPEPVWTPILQAALAGLSGVGGLTVTDAEGVVRHSTVSAVLGQSRRDRYMFGRLQADSGAGLVADTPFRGAASGRMLIPLGRRLSRAGGGFEGITVATLEPALLQDFYGAVDVGASGAIWIFHPAGTLLFRQPQANWPVGAAAADNPLFKIPLPGGAGRYHGPIDATGREVIGAVRALEAPPLLLAVTIDEAEALASWRRQAGQSIGLTATAAAALLLIGAALARQLDARARAERALARRERELHRAQEVARIGSIHLDLPSQTAALSPAAADILGHDGDAARVPLEALLARIGDGDRIRLRDAIQDCADSGKGFGLELRVARPDGRQLTCLSEGTLVIEAPEGHRYVLATLQDVTERRQTEEMLRQSQRLEAIGHLTGGVAHDFNNLLTVILGQADGLAERLRGDRTLGEQAGQIVAAAERAAELTQRLLAFARRQPLEARSIEVNQLVSGVESLLQQTLGEQVEIRLVRGAGLWRAVVDPSQLENALLNLAVNARDAMPQGGRLTIETANAQIDADYAARHGDVTAGRYVLISVADTGVGMPPEVAARAFEPFFTTKELGHGTGLGLSMVYGFVKQSGGHIKIYSEVGHGTIVRIYLPESAAAASEARSATALAEPRGDETILLVEDDALVREHAARLLRELGYRVLVAADGRDALAVLRDNSGVHLLFTDMVMPGGMSGPELVAAARAVRAGLKVLFTSGYSENAALHHGRLDSDASLLSKPYRRPELARAVRQALDQG